MLLSLPEDLAIVVLSHAEPATLVQCKQVCRSLNSLISTTSSLNYKLTLWKYGYSNFPSTEPLSLPQKQERLERLGRGWQDPTWIHPTRVPLLREGTTYELQGGIFVAGRPSLESVRATRGLIFWELPWRDYSHPGQPVPQRSDYTTPTWSIPDVGIDFHDFQIDPSQDLLILAIRGELGIGQDSNIVAFQMRDMSDAKPHPLGGVPVRTIELPRPSENHRLKVIGFVIQILDDLVGILTSFRISNIETPPFFDISVYKSRVDVFNWKTGATHATIEEDGIDSIVFLDDETLMLVRRGGDQIPKTVSLDVFSYSLTTSVQPPTSRGTEYPLPVGARQIARLSLPNLVDDFGMFTHITARCEPTPSYRRTPSQRPRQMQSTPPTIRPSQDARLVSLSFGTIGPDLSPQERSFVFLFLAETIRKLATQYGNNTFTQMQWDAWGPQNTRILQQPSQLQWICYTYGSKFAYLDKSSGPGVITILDFNPGATRTEPDVSTVMLTSGEVVKQWETEQNYGWYRKDRTALSSLGNWINDTFSALPYIKLESAMSIKHANSVMIDQDRVILAVHRLSEEFFIFNV